MLGVVVDLHEADIELNEAVSRQLTNIDEHDFGCLNFFYRNACFNSFGFLTHDTHI